MKSVESCAELSNGDLVMHAGIAQISIKFTALSSISSGMKIATLNSGYRPVRDTYFAIANGQHRTIYISSTGEISYYGASAISANDGIWVRGCYIIA